MNTRNYINQKGLKTFLGTFICVMILYLIGCSLARSSCAIKTPRRPAVPKQPKDGTLPLFQLLGQDDGDTPGDLRQILDDNCFIGDMGRVLCQDHDYEHPSLRGVDRASVNDVYENQDPGCPGYTYPGIYMIEPCDDSRYNYMGDLEWDSNQREWDDFQYGRFSSELDAVRDRFPDNLYAEEMRGNADLDTYLEYKEYVQDPYMNNHEGQTLFDVNEIATVKDYYIELYGTDPGGEIWQK